jgi:hypothetical protein
MYKKLSMAAMVASLLMVGASGAFAQRDAARLGIGKPYYGSGGGGGRSYSSRSGPSFNYARPSYNYVAPQPMIASEPAIASVPGYRSFSLEPIGIHPGDSVVVTGDNAKLMLGSNVLGAAPKGLEFKVTKVINGWLGAVVTVDGREYKGWVFSRNVRLVE